MSDDVARRGMRVAVATIAVVAVAAATLAALGVAKLSKHDDQDVLRDSVLTAARRISLDFAAYDYRNIDKDFARVAAESTGKFRSDYVTQSAGVRELIIKAKAVSTAEITSEGLVDASPHHATVVIAVDRIVRNTSAPNGQRDSFGLEIDLVRSKGAWLATGVKPL